MHETVLFMNKNNQTRMLLITEFPNTLTDVCLAGIMIIRMVWFKQPV